MIKLHPKEKYCMFSTFYAYIYILDFSKAAKLLLISIFVDSNCPDLQHNLLFSHQIAILQ